MTSKVRPVCIHRRHDAGGMLIRTVNKFSLSLSPSASDSPENTKSESQKVPLRSLNVQHTSTGLPVDYGVCYPVSRPCLDCRLLTLRLEGPPQYGVIHRASSVVAE